MQSGNPTLTTLAPAPRQLTLAGAPVFVGKLKLRQKAALQHWLDSMPKPNERVWASLEKQGVTTWPIGVDSLPFLVDEDIESRFAFLRIALPPFNPNLSIEEVDRLSGECSDDDEFISIMLAAFGIDPTKAKRPTENAGEPTDPKE
jgi:hypothetical protein